MLHALRYIPGSCWLFGLLLTVAIAARAEGVDYAKDIQPLLRQHCFSCHSALRQKGGLRLDHVSFLREGGDSGPALEGGAASLLLQALRGTGDIQRMPLDAKPLSDEQIALIESWISAGAPAVDEPLPADPRQHWSFQPPARSPLPDGAAAQWSAHPIDRFISAEHQRRQLVPAGEAAKHVLLRRVYLDLIGLPPSPTELAEFVADPAPDAYEKVVDRLLASPRYAERWARHWMDVWRYSDWDGFGAEVRESQPHIWRWRDWIIEALAADRPYDQMVCEMLAADEVAPNDKSALRAEGFLVRNWFRFNRNAWLENAVEHTSKAFLGITLNCARCHDHMYDPIAQTEYYAFRAIFEPHDIRTDRLPGQSDVTRDGLVHVYDAELERPTYLFQRGNEAKPDTEHPLTAAVPRALGGDPLSIAPVSLPQTAAYPGLESFIQQETLNAAVADVKRTEAALAALAMQLSEARKKATEMPGDAAATTAVATAERAASLAEQECLAATAELSSVRAKLAADAAAFAKPPAVGAAELAREANRAERVANIQRTQLAVLRAERQRSEAEAGDEAAKKKLPDFDKKLAEARTAHETAQAALGKPAETYTRFAKVYPATSTGRRAALARWITSPRNPLTARVAINHIWLRHFGSPLVPTVFDFGLNGKPPTHPALLDWLAVELMENGWRMKPIHRLLVTSKAYRLQSSDANPVNLQRDPENVYLWRMNSRRMEAEVVRDSTLQVAGGLDTTMFGPDLDHTTGLNVPRRSLYFRSSKEKKVTFLEMFDSPNVTDCYRRSETVVPQQALAMVNSSLSLGQARALATRLSAELKTEATPAGLSQFVDAAFECVLCRPASTEERATCLAFLAEQAQRFADPGQLVAFASGEANAVRPAADPHARARENLIHVLLNHNDFLTIR